MNYQRENRKLARWRTPTAPPDPRTQDREQRIALKEVTTADNPAWARMQAIKEQMIAGYRVPLPTTPAQFLSWAMSALVRDVLNEYESRVLEDADHAPEIQGDDE